MPRRYFNSPAEFTGYHQASTIGSYVMGIGFVIAAVAFVRSLVSGKRAAANPWGGSTLEWRCASPPPHDNFATTPKVQEPYHYEHLVYDEQQDGWVEKEPAPVAATAG